MARPLYVRALLVVFGSVLIAGSAAAQGVPRLDSYEGVAVRILQSNNAGNIHHIIDPTVNKVVGVIRGCPHAHNLTVHPDGLYYYCANEQDKTVDVFDTKTLQARSADPAVGAAQQDRGQQEAPEDLCGHRLARPLVDVIDIATHKVVKSIAVARTRCTTCSSRPTKAKWSPASAARSSLASRPSR